jgi:two-component system repressor protein LuxO
MFYMPWSVPMHNKVRRILIVEDAPELAQIYAQQLAGLSDDITIAKTGAEAIASLGAATPDIMLLDLHLPDMNGFEILRNKELLGTDLTVIVMTAYASHSVVVDAMREGAYDFLVKPFGESRLVVTVRNAIERLSLDRAVRTLMYSPTGAGRGSLVGSSLPMQVVYRTIDAAAQSHASVFITGESGTGKELVAEAIHKLGPRKSRPFVVLNCAAIPRDLVESEVFGHVKGAFTGAISGHQGAAAQANGGTLFLDEIGEMEPAVQSKMLRFLQSGRIQRVGAETTEQVDVRIICATNRDPLAQVEAGQFREDLFYRLHVIPVEMPPLRARGADILILARMFLARYALDENKQFDGLSAEVKVILQAHAWPGNVRQLQNTLRNIAVMNTGGLVVPDMLPAQFMRDVPPEAAPAAANAEILPGRVGIRPLEMVERDAIEQAIAACSGDLNHAAVLLGISLATIYRKLRAWRVQNGSQIDNQNASHA